MPSFPGHMPRIFLPKHRLFRSRTGPYLRSQIVPAPARNLIQVQLHGRPAVLSLLMSLPCLLLFRSPVLPMSLFPFPFSFFSALTSCPTHLPLSQFSHSPEASQPSLILSQTYPFIHPSICSSIHVFICPSICHPSVPPTIHSFIH